MAEKIVVITGPTATGKTKMGVALAKIFSGEVVSADSMQLYKFMDIGTAKPTSEETEGIPHHMIGVTDPGDDYSVSRYVEDASKCVDDILARGKLPIIVGGTGLYIDSLVSGRTFAKREENSALRQGLEAEYDALGGEALLKKLAEYDAERAAKLHPNDKKRIVRALEIAAGGENMTAHDEMTKLIPPKYDASYIILNFADRADLYARIDSRVDDMMAAGLENEVKSLMDMGVPGKSTSMQAIGYKEIAAALRGEVAMETAVETVKRSSRRYAKRQTSWCTRYGNACRINWGKFPDFDDGLRISTEFLRGAGLV